MTAPSIYTVGQLRAYLQGRVSVLADEGLQGLEAIRHAATMSAFAEVIGLCEAMEAYQATDAAVIAGHAPISVLRASGKRVTLTDDA